MKKLLVSLLVLFIITGCSKNEDNKPKESNNEIIEVKVDNNKIQLKSTGSFNGITFKYPIEATTMNVGTYYLMDYLDNGNFIFRIAMYYFENKSLDKTMENTTANYKGTKSINNKVWHIYEGKTEDNKNMLNYAYEHNTGTYTITFIFDKSLDDFINVFMNNVRF